MTQTTRDCHIIWQSYMRGFANQDNKLYRSEKEDDNRWGDVIEFGVFKPSGKKKKINFGSEEHLFNYHNGSERIDDLETTLGVDEGIYSDLLKSIHEEIKTTGSLSDETIELFRKNIVDMIEFMMYKIVFSYTKKIKHGSSDVEVTKTERDLIDGLSKLVSRRIFGNILDQISSSDDRKLVLIYIEDDTSKNLKIIPFGDYPMSFQIGGKRKYELPVDDFLENEGSNLYFPLNGQLAILFEKSKSDIEKFKKFSLEDIIQIHTNVWKDRKSGKVAGESLMETILYRLGCNCEQYIAGPFKDIVEASIEYRSNVMKTKYYRKDFFKESLDCNFHNFISQVEDSS